MFVSSTKDWAPPVEMNPRHHSAISRRTRDPPLIYFFRPLTNLVALFFYKIINIYNSTEPLALPILHRYFYFNFLSFKKAMKNFHVNN